MSEDDQKETKSTWRGEQVEDKRARDERVQRLRSLSTAEVLPNLPDWLRPDNGDPLPDGLVGATIVRFGTLQKNIAKAAFAAGGGLVIDYRPLSSDKVRRVVLAISDRETWVVYQQDQQTPSNEG